MSSPGDDGTPAVSPSLSDARALAEAILAPEHPDRWRHSEAVAAEAVRLATAVGVDAVAVGCAGWLHDIGYAVAAGDTGFHPLDGARYLRDLGWPDAVCRLVAHHSDAGGRAVQLGLADVLCAEFPPLPGLESDILWTADATTSPTGQRVRLDERMQEIAERTGANPGWMRAKLESRPAIEAAARRVREHLDRASSASP